MVEDVVEKLEIVHRWGRAAADVSRYLFYSGPARKMIPQVLVQNKDFWCHASYVSTTWINVPTWSSI